MNESTDKKGTPANTLLSFKIQRSENGVELYFQSKLLEDLFKGAGEMDSRYNWSGNVGYNMLDGMKNDMHDAYTYWNTPTLMITQAIPNMSFLRAKGLSNGVKFSLTNNVFSTTELNKYVRSVKDFVKKTYVEYMKPVNTNIEFVVTSTGEIS